MPFKPIPDEVREQLVGPAIVAEGSQKNAVWRDAPSKSSEALDALVDVPPPGLQYRVVLKLVYKDLVYGSDQGILTVLDEGLEFHGMRTDFSLSREKTKLTEEPPTCENGCTHVELRFKSVVEVVVLLEPFQVKASQASEACQEIYYALLKWQHEPSSGAWEEAMEPPVRAQEEVLKAAREKVIMWRIGSGISWYLCLPMLGIGAQDPVASAIVRVAGAILAGCGYAFWAQSNKAAEKSKLLKSMELIAAGGSRTKRRAGALR